MNNSQRIEHATRQHVGAVLTTEQIQELVKLSDPTNTKGVYPSDCAYRRLEDGTLTHRGKMAYGDGVLELVGSNAYKVLPTEHIVRQKNPPVAAAPPVGTGTGTTVKTETQPAAEVNKPKTKRKAA